MVPTSPAGCKRFPWRGKVLAFAADAWHLPRLSASGCVPDLLVQPCLNSDQFCGAFPTHLDRACSLPVSGYGSLVKPFQERMARILHRPALLGIEPVVPVAALHLEGWLSIQC